MKPLKITYRNMRRYIGKEVYVEYRKHSRLIDREIFIIQNVTIEKKYHRTLLLLHHKDGPTENWWVEENDDEIFVWAHPRKIEQVKMELL